MKTYRLLILLYLLLTACAPSTGTPFLDVTPTLTPVPPTVFTARVVVGSLETDKVSTLFLSKIIIHYTVNAQGKVELPTDYTEPICVLSPDDVCKTTGTAELLKGVTVIVESGCWTATPTGNDYTAPQPCAP